MNTRREFIKTASLLAAGTMAVKAFPVAILHPMEKMIGIQLWTLRDLIPGNLLETLEKLSRIGYNSIEPYGFEDKFYGYSPKEFRRIVEGLGMKLTSTHSGITKDNADRVLESAAEAGLEYIILPSFMGRPDKSADDFKRAASEMNQIGEISNKYGIRFGYHNHDFEFVRSEEGILYDILLNETDPDMVSFQLDIYWIIKGGQDPLEYFKTHPGRFETWHVKDMGEDGKSCVVGNGSIDYKAIFGQEEQSGMKRFFVEQESYKGDPLVEVEEGFRFIGGELITR